MHYVVLYYPKFDEKTQASIEAFRRKYDPYAGSLKPHIPFLFPVPYSEVEESRLVEHVGAVLRNWKPFSIQMKGFGKSWDNWLFLLLKRGNGNAIALHDDLYTGILSRYLRRDIEYIPHVGMGLFVKQAPEYNVLDPRTYNCDAKLYSQALKEAKLLEINSFDTIDRLFLEKISINAKSRDLVRIISSEEIRL
jgi:hypothetical protein